MSASGSDAIKRLHVGPLQSPGGFFSEIEAHIGPGVARLGFDAESAAWFIAAVDHAVLAARVEGLAFHHAVFVPWRILEKSPIAGVVGIRHEVARSLPAFHIARGNRPCRAGEIAIASEEIEVDRRAEEGVFFTPGTDIFELSLGHLTGEEEIFRLEVEPFHHVLLGRIVVVAGGDGVSIHSKPGKVVEHPLEFLHFRLFVDRGVRGDLIAKHLGHADSGDAFLKNTLPLNDKIMRALEAVEVHIPIHPPRGCDHMALSGFGRADFGGLGLSDQFLAKEDLKLARDFCRIAKELRRQVVAHLSSHEHSVRADVNDAPPRQQAVDECFDVWVDERLAAADRDHRSAALLSGTEAIVEGHHILQRCRILANASATCASEIAGVQGLELENGREFFHAACFLPDDVARNARRECQRKPHEPHDIERGWGSQAPQA